MTATLLFDLDGTLVETDDLHFRAFEVTLGEHGIALDWPTYRDSILGQANPVIARNMLPHVAVERHAAIMDSKEVAYRAMLGELKPVAGLVELLDWAAEAGVPCGVVTNAPRLNAERVLDALGLTDRFAALVIGPELADAKPHPLPYLRGLELLGGTAAASVAFEDSPSGARSAKAAGLGVVGLLTSFPEPVLRGEGVDLAVRDFLDPALPAFLRARTAPGGSASHRSPTPLESVSPKKG